MSSEDYGVHWFRRDLRIAGNQSLMYQFSKHHGKVLGIFCFDQKFLRRPDFSINRFQFFIETLKSLKEELRAMGSDLLVLDKGPQEAFCYLFDELKQKGIKNPTTITWGRDYEPYAINRDREMEEFFRQYECEVRVFRDHLLIEPEEIQKGDGTAYKVYTPFSRKWLEVYRSSRVQSMVASQKSGLNYLKALEKGKAEKIFNFTWKQLFKNQSSLNDQLSHFDHENKKRVTIPIPKAGSLAALAAMKEFKKKIENYHFNRDFPNLKAGSFLSIFLKNGSLTTSQIMNFFKLQAYQSKDGGEDTFFSELIWREFYYHILYHFPYVEKECFTKKYNQLNWENRNQYFTAWKNGVTGFPIVDAGMRELKSTGFMHNRVRMIVASFLTKDLLIDWKWGERYFMEALLDGDIAANNGGWQWAASTGVDAQPYFRIFNPWSQSKKFDLDGSYIKHFIPELREMDSKKLHEPIIDHDRYPRPIVDHRVQREKALALFKSVK